MSDQDRFGLAKSEIEAKRKALEAELNASLQQANTPASINTSEAIAQGILGMLPMLLGGAIAGKRGMGAGAQSGHAASEQYGETVKEKGKLAQENARLQAKALLGQMTGLDKASTSLDIAGVKADAAGDLQGRRAQDAEELERERQANRIALKGIPGAPAAMRVPEPRAAALLARMNKEGSGDLSEDDYQYLIDSGHLADLQKTKGQEARGAAGEEAHNRRLDVTLKERHVEGLELRKDEKGETRIPSAKEAEEVRSKFVAWKNLDSRFNQAAEIFGDPKATAAQKVAIIDRLVVNMKEADGMGANFTQLEERLQKSGLPPVATIEKARLMDFVIKDLNQQDPIGALRSTQAIFRDEMDNSLGKYTFAKAPQTPSANSDIQSRPDGSQWQIVRDSSGKAIGKKRVQ